MFSVFCRFATKLHFFGRVRACTQLVHYTNINCNFRNMALIEPAIEHGSELDSAWHGHRKANWFVYAWYMCRRHTWHINIFTQKILKFNRCSTTLLHFSQLHNTNLSLSRALPYSSRSSSHPSIQTSNEFSRAFSSMTISSVIMCMRAKGEIFAGSSDFKNRAIPFSFQSTLRARSADWHYSPFQKSISLNAILRSCPCGSFVGFLFHLRCFHAVSSASGQGRVTRAQESDE